MNAAQEQKISRCLDLNIFLLKVSLAWPGAASESRWKNWLYICFKVCFGSMICFNTFGIACYCLVVHDNLEHVIENIIILAETINVAAKASAFNVYRKELYYLTESIPRNFFADAACHINDVQMTLTMSTINYVRRICIGMPLLYVLTAGIMASHPLFVQSEGYGHNSSISSPKVLPFPTWYPFVTEENSYYELQYAFQTIGVLSGALVNVVGDVLSIALLTYLAFQFQILNMSVRDMSENVMLKLKAGTRDRNLSTESFKGLDKIGKIGRRSTSHMGSLTVSEVEGHRQGYTCDDQKYNAGSVQIVMDESRRESDQRNIEAKTLRYLKSCIRHHQSLLE
jgi:hypothetical protein